MSRRTITLLAIVILFIVGAAGAFYFWQQSNAARAAASATRQTGTLARGQLSAGVSGAGNVTAPQQANLSFRVSGVPVTKLNVKIGDAVKQGDVLAEADATEWNEQVKTAETNLESARAKLDELKAPATEDELAVAESQVKGAQASYDSAVAKLQALQAPPSAAKVQAARAQLAAAQLSYETALAKSKLLNDQILIQRATVEKARIALEAAQAAYNAIAWQDNAPNSGAAKGLQTATIDYETAQANYNLSMTELNDSALRSAEASLANAKQSLDDVTSGATDDQLKSAQAAVESAQQALIQAQQNLDGVKTGATETTLLDAQASVESTQNALTQAQRARDDAKIIAPFDGIIADIDTFVGKNASSGATAITLVNMSDLQILVSLSEIDVADVKRGQEVELAFDALNGRTLPGKVIAVLPLGTTSQGVVNYNVTIAFTNPDPNPSTGAGNNSRSGQVLPGMTAQASIITARVNDALLAPNRAIRTQGNRRVMTVLFEGREIPVFVQTGLQNESSTQILSATMSDGQTVNLQEGDTVLLNTTTTNNRTQGGNVVGFGPGGGGFAVPIR